jgi:hypothetical protein
MTKSLLSDNSYNELVNCVFEVLKSDNLELGKIVALGKQLVDTLDPLLNCSPGTKKKLLFEIVEKGVENVQKHVSDLSSDTDKKVYLDKLPLYVSQLKEHLSTLLAMKPYFSWLFGLCGLGVPAPLEPTAVPPQMPTELPVNHRPILNVLDSIHNEPVLLVNPPSTVVEENPQEVVLRIPKHDLD